MTAENNVSAKIEINTQWYKNRWVWLVIAIPVMAVMMSLTTVYFAFFGSDTLVRDHYYKDGLAINQELDAEIKAQDLGIKAQLTLDGQTGEIWLQLTGYQDFPAQLQLLIIHPTIAGNDQDIVLEHQEHGRYLGNLISKLHGRYHLQLMSNSQKWRIKVIRDINPDQTYFLP